MQKPEFFRDIAQHLEIVFGVISNLLTMVPFVSDTLESLFCKIMSVFIRKEVLEATNTSYNLIKLGVSNK